MMIGKVVEVRHVDFQFFQDNKPTKEFMRGEVLKKINDSHYLVESYFTGNQLTIHQDFLIVIDV